MNVNSILLRRKNKLLVHASKSGTTSRALIATFNANLHSLGYTLSPKLLKALEKTSEATATKLFDETLSQLKEIKGVRAYRPMYPNFPKQVMEADVCELYFNAILHYWSFAVVDLTGDPDMIWLPKYDKEKRALLDEKTKVQVIDLATEDDVHALATAIATSNTSISPTDKEDLRQLFRLGYLTFPDLVPNKENLAVLGAMFITTSVDLAPHFKTVTDVLRLATAMSDGDVSLTDDSKFRSFSRPERKFLLALINKCGTAAEDMLRWKERWLRLGERLHPGDFAKKFKNAYRAFSALRNEKITTIRTHIEQSVRSGNVLQAISLLTQRPGDFARRLDHVLRQAETKTVQNRVVSAFLSVASEVSTPVLLQVLAHFKNRESDVRVVFPKGNVAKVMSIAPVSVPLPETVTKKIVNGIEEVLVDRFAKLPKLGKVYIDPQLADCLVPFSQRSASKSFRTLVRGSKLSFGEDKDTLRFFIWWKETPGYRADLDLSASLLNEDFGFIEALTYYNLRGDFGCHSGDITSAPNGASEFIDINIPKAIKQGARYLVMDVRAFTMQNFSELAECFAGWMLREKPQSGEIYDPRTVADKVDITMEAKAGIPLIIDLVERKMIWVDAAMSLNHYGYNNVRSNKGTIELLGKALTSVHKPNLYDLLSLHAEGRGKIVSSPDKADVVFSVESGLPFELERIASEFMSDVKVDKAAAGKRR